MTVSPLGTVMLTGKVTLPLRETCMRSREKYFWQSLIGLLAALYLVFSISESNNLRVLDLFFRWVLRSLGPEP